MKNEENKKIPLSPGFIERLTELPGVRITLCPACEYYLGGRSCLAFREIPEAIWRGEFLHTKEWPGDGGIRYKPKD